MDPTIAQCHTNLSLGIPSFLMTIPVFLTLPTSTVLSHPLDIRHSTCPVCPWTFLCLHCLTPVDHLTNNAIFDTFSNAVTRYLMTRLPTTVLPPNYSDILSLLPSVAYNGCSGVVWCNLKSHLNSTTTLSLA